LSASQGRALRIRQVAAYLQVSHQRVAQRYAEGKLPEPERVDGIGPTWSPATIERWADGSGGRASPLNLSGSLRADGSQTSN
jgi:predicted DNA-binding transcriptional regulator AlpA